MGSPQVGINIQQELNDLNLKLAGKLSELDSIFKENRFEFHILGIQNHLEPKMEIFASLLVW
jgi:hypothetical protein